MATNIARDYSSGRRLSMTFPPIQTPEPSNASRLRWLSLVSRDLSTIHGSWSSAGRHR